MLWCDVKKHEWSLLFVSLSGDLFMSGAAMNKDLDCYFRRFDILETCRRGQHLENFFSLPEPVLTWATKNILVNRHSYPSFVDQWHELLRNLTCFLGTRKYCKKNDIQILFEFTKILRNDIWRPFRFTILSC
jgi:hypothetical protein